jgi:hypothetical protein
MSTATTATNPPGSSFTVRIAPPSSVGTTTPTRTASPQTRQHGTALYTELREETDLTATLVQEAIRRAVQATKGCVERWKQGKRVSQPEFTSWSMVYDKRSATFSRDHVSLSTVNGRVECDYGKSHRKVACD